MISTIYRLLGALLVIILGLIFQFNISILGSEPDFVLAALISLAFFLNFFETIFFIVLVDFIINWQPIIGWELILLSLIPILFLFLKKIIPGKLWFTNLIFLAVGIIVFNLGANTSLFLENLDSFIPGFIISLLFGIVIFWAFRRSFTPAPSAFSGDYGSGESW